MESTINPFLTKNLEEVPLKNAPLVRVIAQVRFPPILSIGNPEYIAKFQESLRSDYPVNKIEKSFLVNLLNPKDKKEEVIWRFIDKSDSWRVTLAPEALTFETKKYQSRKRLFR